VAFSKSFKVHTQQQQQQNSGFIKIQQLKQAADEESCYGDTRLELLAT
jgi:hypothetical protein